MKKNKIIIISTIIALLITIIGSRVIKKYVNEEGTQVYVTKTDILEGEKVEIEDLMFVYIKNTDTQGYITKENKETLENKIAIQNIDRGQILQDKYILNSNDYEEKQSKIKAVVPLNKACNALAYRISKGESINIYYTARASQVEEVLKDKEKMYSTGGTDGMVTAKILENITVLGIYDEEGNEKNMESFSQLMILVDKKEAMMISNLKEQGVFDICLMN